MNILHITAIGFMVPNSGVPAVLKALVEEQNKIDGVKARVVSLRSSVKDVNSPYFDELHENEMADYIKRFRPDIAIFHTIFYLKFVKMVHQLKKFNVPFVIEPHGSFGKQAMQKSRFKKVIAVNTLFKSIVKGSVAYIYTNKAEKSDSIFQKKITSIIPNGIYENIVASAGVKNLNLSPVFYYLGRYDIHHKGLDYLMDAIKILDERHLDLTIYFYGVGSEEEVGFINQSISSLQFVKAYERGTIYGVEKKRALEEANILLLTSRYEGSPMTVLDALSYGNPCLVTTGTNVAEEMAENNIGWITELNAKAIADTIQQAIVDYSNDARGYYQRAKQHVLENYSWSKLANFSIGEYQRFIDSI